MTTVNIGQDGSISQDAGTSNYGRPNGFSGFTGSGKFAAALEELADDAHISSVIDRYGYLSEERDKATTVAGRRAIEDEMLDLAFQIDMHALKSKQASITDIEDLHAKYDSLEAELDAYRDFEDAFGSNSGYADWSDVIDLIDTNANQNVTLSNIYLPMRCNSEKEVSTIMDETPLIFK